MPDTALPTDDISVIARLRRQLMDGQLPPGSRLTEEAVAEALGVSRTPVRLALRSLEQEGLLQRTGKRGLVVRAFTEADVRCGVEVRGALEGLAARRLAERGPSGAELAALDASLQAGRDLLAAGRLRVEDMARWSALNQAFHAVLVHGAGSPVIGEAIRRNNHLPFASADAITLDPNALDREYERLRIAQLQHELVRGALVQREATRVEQLVREHAWIGLRYGALLAPRQAPAIGP